MNSIMIIDDSVSFIESAVKHINYEKKFSHVSWAVSLEEASIKIQYLQPDIILLDVRLNEHSGFDFIESIKQKLPKTRVFMISINEGEYYENHSEYRGADGFFSKSQFVEKLKTILYDKIVS